MGVGEALGAQADPARAMMMVRIKNTFFILSL
jgi:hypothetical protein